MIGMTAKRDVGRKLVNLRTQFPRIIRNAGLTTWPRLWVNLRSSCSTELAERFPGHVVSRWLGHSNEVAVEHYRQVTEEHFRLAAETTSKPMENSRAQSGQSLAILGNLGLSAAWTRNEETPEKQGFCELVTVGEESKDYPARIRTNAVFQLENAIPAEFRAQTGQIGVQLENGARPETGALVAGLTQALAMDADLRRLAAVWERFSPDDRQALASHAEAMAAARGVRR